MRSLLLALMLVSCTDTKIEKVIEQIQVEKNIDFSLYPEAKEELAETIKRCGEGVVKGSEGEDGKEPENNCGYQIDPTDEIFLRPTVAKTGLLHEEDGFSGKAKFRESHKLQAPEKWDMRELGKVSQVKVNRQTCGDCWSQASTKALEIMIAAHDEKLYELSVQTQISSCSDHGTCNGGFMSAPQFLVDHGNPFETQDPYQGKNSYCKFSDDELKKGFEAKLVSAPYVGRSTDFSRYHKVRKSPSAKEIMRMMYEHKSPAVATVAAYSISGDGVYDSCTAVNSQGNHMVDIVGWENSGEIAHVWNSWGTSHGKDGISRIKWECGAEGKFNRGLGYSARVYIYQPNCVNQPDAYTGPNAQFIKLSSGSGVVIGKDHTNNQKCKWIPETGLTYFDESHCKAFASPEKTTEYHLTAVTECDEETAMVLVTPLGPLGEASKEIVTPFGLVSR